MGRYFSLYKSTVRRRHKQKITQAPETPSMPLEKLGDADGHQRKWASKVGGGEKGEVCDLMNQ